MMISVHRQLAACFLLAGCALPLAAADSPPPAPGPPAVRNLVVVSIDSLRADHLGIYGYAPPTSPAIDKLARSAVVFDRAYSTTSWTLPSHTALFTGQDDLTHGVVTGKKKLPDSAVTLAEELTRLGIETTGFISGPYLLPFFGLHQGFGSYVNATSYAGKSFEKDLLIESHSDVTNPILVDKIGAWLQRVDTSRRHFVFIHMWDVHYDYIAPKSYVDMFDPDYEGPISGRSFHSNRMINAEMSWPDLRHLMAQYDAEIRYTDDTLGRILEMLGGRGILDSAAVIVLADHGEEFFDHGGKGHRRTLHEEVVRIPLILRIMDDKGPARRISEVVSLVDLYSTVCDLLTVECSYNGPGESLAGYVHGSATTPRQRGALLRLVKPNTSQAGLVLGANKVIRNNEGMVRYYRMSDGGVEVLLWEHWSSNPAPMAPPVQAIVERLEAREAAASEAGELLYAGKAPDAQVDAETLRRLKSLGYVD